MSEERLTEEQFKGRFPEYAHTWDWDKHPDGYDGPCACFDCRQSE